MYPILERVRAEETKDSVNRSRPSLNGRLGSFHSPQGDYSWSRPEDPQQDQFYGKISDVEKETAAMNGRFLRVHHSFLVNFDYIKMMSFATLELLDGQSIPISEDRRKAVGVRFAALSETTMK